MNLPWDWTMVRYKSNRPSFLIFSNSSPFSVTLMMPVLLFFIMPVFSLTFIASLTLFSNNSIFVKPSFKNLIPEAPFQEVLLRKDVMKICSKFTGELLCNFIEITLCHRCSPVNLLHIFRTPFPKNTSGWLLLTFFCESGRGWLGAVATYCFKGVFKKPRQTWMMKCF